MCIGPFVVSQALSLALRLMPWLVMDDFFREDLSVTQSRAGTSQGGRWDLGGSPHPGMACLGAR